MNTYTYSDELYSDFHKDALGFRPRGSSWSMMTPDEKQAEWDFLENAFQQSVDQENLEKEQAVAAFKTVLKETIALGAGDEITALRWLSSVENLDNSQDIEHWFWEWGILFTDYGTEIISKFFKELGIFHYQYNRGSE